MAPKKKAAGDANAEADKTRCPDGLPLEYLAAFMATEEANEEQQRSKGADRAQWAAEAYKRHLPALLADENVKKLEGGVWKNKVWTAKNVSWTPEMSMQHRAASAVKMHVASWTWLLDAGWTAAAIQHNCRNEVA